MNTKVTIDRGVSARDVTVRPLCECHGRPLSWNRRADLPKGGYWQCKYRYKATTERWRAANRERLRANGLAWRNANLGKAQDMQRKYRYGMPEGEYDAMLARQGGTCAICHVLPEKSGKGVLHIDHDHATGTVRGLLCNRCNSALERVEIAGWHERALAYLEGAS